MYVLYSAAIEADGNRLFDIAQSEARLIEAIVRHEEQHLDEHPDHRGHFMDIIKDAHAQYEGFGETGEFTLARLEGDQITFLLSHRHSDLDTPEPVPMDSELAEPMRRALQGESGIAIALDYRGVMVLAAYEPVDPPNLGVVAKVDLAEIRAPYFQAMRLALAPAIAAILLGAWLFSRVTRPIMRHAGETQQQFQTLIETMQDGLAVQDDAGILRYVNDQFSRMLARGFEDLVGQPIAGFMTEKSQSKYREQMRLRRQGVSAGYELTFLRSDGMTVNTLVSPQPIFDTRNRYRGSFGVITDITHLKEIERQLRHEKELAQRYLDIAGVMIVVLDSRGRVELMNRRGLEILGYTSDRELLGKYWFEIAIPEDVRAAVCAEFDRLISGTAKSAEYFENAILTRDGSKRVIAWRNTTLRDNEGNIVGTLSSGEDITEQRQAEEDRIAIEMHLRQGQKLESIGTLASGVAHEINNPLTGMINYAQLIHDRTQMDTLRDYARGIIDEGNRVAKIVSSLLSFSRQESERHSPAHISDILDTTLSLVGSILRKDQIQLTVDIQPDLPMLKCRSQQIEQVLINLLTNARDALNERYPEYHGDKILTIRVKCIDREDREWIRVIVEDHGAGIPPDIIERIFDPFFSTKSREKGTGLGLSISYGLVRDHHGQLLVESEPNAYTRFTMDLPVENGWSLEP